MKDPKAFTVLSGPSGAGKGPLQHAIARFRPGFLSARPVLCHSREPRDREAHGRDYYFLPPALIRSLQTSPDFVVKQVHTEWQALDLVQLEQLLDQRDHVFAEVFYTFGGTLGDRAPSRGFTLRSVFLLPVPPDTPNDVIAQTMQQKLSNRGTDTGNKLSDRAQSAPAEMKVFNTYTHPVLNPATEDDVEEWGELGTRDGKPGERPINGLDDLGPNARWLVETFIDIAEGRIDPLPRGSYLTRHGIKGEPLDREGMQ